MVIKFKQLVDMGSQKIQSLLDPTAAQDAATKNYVDTMSRALNTTTVTTTYSATSTVDAVLANSATAFTVTLPSASSAGAGRVYYVKNINTGTVTVATSGGTIDTATTIALAQWDARTFLSDGTNWNII